MDFATDWTRRKSLRAGAALGLATAAGHSGIAPASAADAAPAALTPVKIVDPSGLASVVPQEMLTELGYFKEQGLAPQYSNVSDGSKILAALISGYGDVCIGSGITSLFPAIAQGAKLKILAGAAVSPLTAIFAKSPDIKEAKDLIGKNVGVGAPGALLHVLVVALLQKKGLDYRKVNFVNVGSSPDVFKAVVQGRVDAGPAEVDFFEQQRKYGVHALTDGLMWDELPDFTNQGIYTTDETIAKKREVLVKVLVACCKLFRFIASPQSKQAFFHARAVALGKDLPEDAESQWQFYQSGPRYATNLLISPESIHYMQQLNVELGVQKTIVPFDQVADMSLAQEALKRLGGAK